MLERPSELNRSHGHFPRATAAAVLLLLVFASSSRALSITSPPTGLKLEFLSNPVGVDTQGALHFTWQSAVSAQRLSPPQTQSYSQIIVNQTLPSGEITRTAFDSGAVSNQFPEYVGEFPLQSDATYVWSVRTSVSGDAFGPWAAPSKFTTGLLSEWRAKWIRGGTQMRRDFRVSAPPHRATVFVSACQYYELYLDGKRIGDHMLDVGWTSFKTNRSYATHEIEPSALTPGNHTLGLRVGQGFCTRGTPLNDPHVGDDYDPTAERSALLQLQLHDASDAVSARVVTDESWSVSDGPILMDSTYYGEIYDARREQPGWSSPSFVPPAGREWPPAILHGSHIARWAYCTAATLHGAMLHGGHIARRPHCTEAILHAGHIARKPYYTLGDHSRPAGGTNDGDDQPGCSRLAS